ncbi:MAG: two-component sensor histidine kinase, partial [Candidatus Hydrogenedentota bacterium]
MTKQDQRPDPDRLLAELKAASGKSRRGKLTVFLGMCAGVGKTYAMLMSARRMRGTGIDVLAAVVETHGRVETEALLDGLPRLPLKEIAYRGTTLREMDLEVHDREFLVMV